MATSTIPTSTNFRAAVARHTARMKDAFRYARSRATAKQDEAYPRECAKKTLSSERSAAVEYVVAMTIDAARRGTLEDAESVGLQLAAIARAEYAAAHPSLDVELSVAEAHIAEEIAEGSVEVAETRMAREPTTSNLMAFLAASAKHARARRELDAAVRRDLARTP